MTAGPSKDDMYAMFSEMLDRKLKEMKLVNEKGREDQDIPDDYMKQMEAENVDDNPHNSRDRMRKKSSGLVRPVSFAV